MTPPPSPPTERVLSTLNQDGSRRWLHPRLARGRFLRRRRIVAAVLIGLFLALPLVNVGGRPALLIDLMTRELSVLGAVLRPSDDALLLLLGLAIALSVFVVTALWGRVWCGWGCPHTVYLEHVFRPVDRWIGRWLEGSPAEQAKRPMLHPRRLAKWLVYAALAFALANVFLAYFVGVARLRVWVLESPLEHRGGFGVVAAVSLLMLANFGWFREQTCIVACPYGRLQSVLLDRQSLIVGYDARRGEPRGKRKKSLPVLTEPVERGDCVDCGACVTVCPTGIDIRDGLQMECVGCAQCIDACDAVMDRLHQPHGLIGYSSKAELAGEPRRPWRPRVIIYPMLVALVGSLLAWSLATRTSAEISVLRNDGPSFTRLPDGRIAAQVRLKIENETDEPRSYTVALVGAADASLTSPLAVWPIAPHRAREIPMFVEAARASFPHGARLVQLRVSDGDEFSRVITAGLLGPSEGTP